MLDIIGKQSAIGKQANEHLGIAGRPGHVPLMLVTKNELPKTFLTSFAVL